MKNKRNFTLYRKVDEPKVWFKEKPEEGEIETHEFCVKKPDNKIRQKADAIYSAKAHELYKAGAMLRAEIEKSKEHNEKVEKLETEIRNKRIKLSKGGMSKREGYNLAVSIIELNNDLNELNSAYNVVDRETIEAKAEDTRFNYLLAHSLYHNAGEKEGQLYFSSYEDMLDSEDSIVQFAGLELLLLTVDIVEMRKNLAEYKFLIKYQFVDEELRLKTFDKKNYCDTDGRLVDKDGYFINDNGDKVDKWGNPINPDGTYAFDEVEFTDD